MARFSPQKQLPECHMQVKSNDFFFALSDICTSLQPNSVSLQLLFPFIDFSMSSRFTNVMLLRKLVHCMEFFKKCRAATGISAYFARDRSKNAHVQLNRAYHKSYNQNGDFCKQRVCLTAKLLIVLDSSFRYFDTLRASS